MQLKPSLHTSLLLTALLVTAVLFSGCSDRKAEIEAPAPVAQEPVPVRPVAPSSIHESIRNGDTTAFMTWLYAGEGLNDINAQGWTPLMTSAAWNRRAYVRDLLAADVDTEIQDGAGHAALHLAALSNHLDVIDVLIEGGANPTLADADGLSAMDLASMHGHAEAAERLSRAIDAYLAPEEVVETVEETVEEEITEAVLLSTDFRTWTSASGSRIEAAFIQCIFDQVLLQAPDGTMLRIAINRLSPDDQILARKLSGIDPVALAGARRTTRGSTGSRSVRTDSLAARIGSGSGWTKLEGCRLLSNDSNDGDSFHVRHDGKEYIFRLYYVDAAETHNDYPDRVRDQARYFKVGKNETLKLGREAARFTASLLAGTEFNVYTRWTDARGQSQLKRYFALVETPLGDLDELLAREGLVRIYGMQAEGGGSRKDRVLQKLEREARSEKVGAWRY